MQLNGVNYPIQKFMLSYSVNKDTHPETDKLLPMSQSRMQIELGLTFLKYSDNVDFPVFFLPKISNELLDANIFSSIFKKGATV